MQEQFEEGGIIQTLKGRQEARWTKLRSLDTNYLKDVSKYKMEKVFENRRKFFIVT